MHKNECCKLCCSCLPTSILHYIALGIPFQCQILRIQNLMLCVNSSKFSLLLHRASCRFTKYHTTNKCTNCMSFILNHFFKTLFLLLHVSIAYHLSSSGLAPVHLPPCTRYNLHKYRICWHNNIITKKFIFLTRDFS